MEIELNKLFGTIKRRPKLIKKNYKYKRRKLFNNSRNNSLYHNKN